MKGTRDLIFRVAKKLFARNGLTDTTMDDVAKEAHIGKGTIYHYFDSKEQIYCLIIEQDMDEIKKELEKLVAAESTPDKKLAAYIMGRMKFMSRFSGFYQMFRKDYIDYYGYIRKAYEKYRDFEMGNITQFIKEGVEKNLFRIEDPDFAAFVIVQAIKGMEYQLALETPVEVERKVGIMLKIFLTGITNKAIAN
jgi:AcrR family transcriptional regulator